MPLAPRPHFAFTAALLPAPVLALPFALLALVEVMPGTRCIRPARVTGGSVAAVSIWKEKKPDPGAMSSGNGVGMAGGGRAPAPRCFSRSV